MKAIIAFFVFLQFTGIAIGQDTSTATLPTSAVSETVPTPTAEVAKPEVEVKSQPGVETQVASPVGKEATIDQAAPAFTQIPPDMVGCALGECQGIGSQSPVGSGIAMLVTLMVALRALAELLTMLEKYTKTNWEGPVIKWIGVIVGILAKITGTFSAGKTQLTAHKWQPKPKNG